MLDINFIDHTVESTPRLRLDTITVIETESEPDAIGSLVTVRDTDGNLLWGFKGASSDGDRWLDVGTLDEASQQFDQWASVARMIWVNDFGSFTSAADLGCPID